MLIDEPEGQLFYQLHRALLLFVNQKLAVIPNKVATPAAFGDLSPDLRLKVRDALLDNLQLIDAFVAENPARFSDAELEIVRSWRHLVRGKFFVFRELAKYTVFLTTSNSPVAYGVLALAQPFEELVGPNLPVMVEAVLLPFEGRIVYDGLMTAFSISFGPGIRRSLNESYKEAKARHGIVTSLPMSNLSLEPNAPKAKPPKPKPVSRTLDREAKDEAIRDIVGLIDQFCQEHLNDEYAVLCRKLAEKLGRKRPSPLLQGNPNAWASGIVRAIGGVNFLHDKSQTPYMRSADIDHCFGISPSSGAAKLTQIRKMLRMHPLDTNWMLPSRLESNPLVWTVEFRGFPIDVRHAPRAVQEIAFRKGLIPYIPADRPRAD